MNPQLITETSLTGLRPLGIGGRRVLESWHELDAAIRAHLDPRYARLLAEPVMGERGIAWFAEQEGEVVPYAALPPGEAAGIVRETAHRVAKLTELAATLRASSEPDMRRLADTLERALAVPSEEAGRGFLYAILRSEGAAGDQVVADPVLVNWGTRDDLPDPPLGVLEFFLKRHLPASSVAPDPTPPSSTSEPDQSPIPPPPPPPVPRPGPSHAGEPNVERVRAPTSSIDAVRAGSVLLWLLLALLVTFGLYLALSACGLRSPFFTLFGTCGATAGRVEQSLVVASQRGAELQAQIAELEARLSGLPPCAGGLDTVPTRTAPPRAATEPEIEQLDEELLEAGGTVGEVTLTLEWRGDSDLDLAVICPGGATISYRPAEQLQPACSNGLLDVDANADPTAVRHDPIENITWPSKPPMGQYRVEVSNFNGRSSGNAAVPFRLRVKIGTDQEIVEGLVAEREPPVSHSFVVH